MAGRKLLYILRRPIAQGHADALLPRGALGSADTLSVVLLDAAVTDTSSFPGRTFLLKENGVAPLPRPGAEPISYADLVKLMIEADSTIVL